MPTLLALDRRLVPTLAGLEARVSAGGFVPTMARNRQSAKSLRAFAAQGAARLSDRAKRRASAAITAEKKASEKEAQKLAQKLLKDPRYTAGLKKRLNSGRCQPGVEVAVWQYAFGKPVETIENKAVVPVRIVHEYT